MDSLSHRRSVFGGGIVGIVGIRSVFGGVGIAIMLACSAVGQAPPAPTACVSCLNASAACSSSSDVSAALFAVHSCCLGLPDPGESRLPASCSGSMCGQFS